MQIILALIVVMISSISAFRSARSNANLRLLALRAGSTVPDAQKPFYALGVNVARQVGGELKGILTKEEIGSMLSGFSDSMLSQAGDETALLQT